MLVCILFLINNCLIKSQLNFSVDPQAIVGSFLSIPTTCYLFHFCLPSSQPDSDLKPFTTYEYRVRGWNSFGRASSDATTVTTSEDKPWGVAPPRWSRIGERDDIIQWQWQAPAWPNGMCLCACM